MPEINLRCVAKKKGYGFTVGKLYANADIRLRNGKIVAITVPDDKDKNRMAACSVNDDGTIQVHGYSFKIRPIPGVSLD